MRSTNEVVLRMERQIEQLVRIVATLNERVIELEMQQKFDTYESRVVQLTVKR